MTASEGGANQLVDMMNGALESTIPIAHKMGVKVVEARPGFAATSVPAEGNGNHFGVIYAGVQFTVAEMLGGVIVLKLAGWLGDKFKGTPQTAYLIMFVICGLSYLTAWSLMKALVPRHKPITDL